MFDIEIIQYEGISVIGNVIFFLGNYFFTGTK